MTEVNYNKCNKFCRLRRYEALVRMKLKRVFQIKTQKKFEQKIHNIFNFISHCTPLCSYVYVYVCVYVCIVNN